MFWIIAAIVGLWALGLVSSYTLGGYIHVLLIVAGAMLLFRLIAGHHQQRQKAHDQ
jgi:Flp pilus assembly protein TadB